MDEQRAWLRARRKRRLRILAVMLSVCVLFTIYPDILATLSVFASEEAEQSEGRYISGFTALSKEVREQSVPLGTGLQELSLPDALEAYISAKDAENSGGGVETPGDSVDGDDSADKTGDEGRESEDGKDVSGENESDGGEQEPGGGNKEEKSDGETTDGDNQSDNGDLSGEEESDGGDNGEGNESDHGESDGENEPGNEETASDGEENGVNVTGETRGNNESSSDDTEQNETGNADHAESDEAELKQETYTVTMPEYQAENAGTAEVKMLIGGVTWDSAPAYDEDTAGTYIFTAALPEGYTLAEGVSMPVITVTVESGTDVVIQALLDRIAALPEAEQYLATEPNMDDEDAYVEWEEKLYAYAGEALAIWEEYEALTDGQQAHFSEENVEKLTAWVEIAKTVRESAQVMAADSGTCGDNVTWELDADGVLTIRGSGAMQDYEDKQSPFYKKSGIKKVILADGVTSVGAYAFQECTSLAEVDMPSSVTGIGSLAFDRCTSLKTMEIPSSVRSIGNQAFRQTELTSITIPSGVTSIEQYTFSECRSLEKVEIPSSVRSIGEQAFSSCRSLTEVTIPKGVTSIGMQAFYACTSLTEVTIADSVESIDRFAFGMCGSLTTVNFQGMVPPKLGKGIFEDDLTAIYIPSCQYLEAYQAAEGWNTYQEKLTASDHDGFTYTAAGAAVTQRCACGSVSATATLSIREGANLDYTGSAITPVQVTYSDNWVEQDGNKPDETSISYENNINPGEAKAKLEIGGATAEISFTITERSYQVTLHTDGGEGGTDLTSYIFGTGTVLPTNWEKTGYVFDGWYDNENFTGTAVTNISGTDTGDKEYWAKWMDNIAPVIGTLTYNYQPKNLWHWLIGKDSLIITVPVKEEGSGADEITYTVTPDGGTGKVETAAIENGKATITVSADFKGTVSVVCTDRAGNTSAGVTVGASLSATGIIIEDHAPGITTDARTDYYDTPAAVNVTVKDDTGNAITAGIASVTYQVGSGTVQSVTVDTSALQAQITFTIPASEIPTGITEITVTAADNAGNEATESFPVKVKGPEETPAAEIDYREAELTGLVPGGIYSINGTEFTADREGGILIDESWFGTTINIVRKGNGSESTDSPAQSFLIPARPQRPTPTGVDVSTAGGTGKLTGLTAGATYEVSTDGGKTWVSQTADGSGQITGLAPGTYIVRVKAGDANFVSESSDSVEIGAYQIKVTFMVDGTKYEEITVDYGVALTDIPSLPTKENAIGEWCMDEQGTTPAVFTNITADMTVYAVYTTVYTVTLQGGTGYTLSVQNGSTSPVKEGGSFTFRFALAGGYQKTGSFAVKVNGVKVELTADGTYTISDIRENKTVTVEGVAKKPGGKPSNSGDGDKEDDPAPTQPPSEPSGDTPSIPPVDRPAKVTSPAPGISSPAAEKEPEDRKPGTIPRQEKGSGTEKKEETEETETETASAETGVPKADSTDAQAADSADAGQTEKGLQEEKREVQIGNGTVIVTVVCEEEKCTAVVADTEKVVKAVLTPDQQELVNGGETIEIRIDVTDISEKVPAQDKEVIESGIEAYREEVPGLVLGMYVDISMFIKIGAGDWNAITETDEPIEVVVNIPEKLLSDGREFYIIRAHNGEYTFMNDMDDVPDTITVSTDLFSSYAIAYVETEETGTDDGAKCGLCHICPTFLGICYFIWLAIIIALVLVIYLIIRRRRQEEKNEKQ